MKKYLLIIPWLTIPCFCLAQGADPGGWTKAKWGMTEIQVMALFPGQIERIPMPERNFDEMRKLRIPEFRISNLNVEVIFEFGVETDKLRAVTLKPITPAPGQARGSFGRLENLLTEKYGEPKIKDVRPPLGNSIVRVWDLLTTNIALDLFYSGSLESCYLRYTQRHRDIKGLESL